MNVIELLEEMGVESKRSASTKGGEYHSRCPDKLCDGKDRFCVWPKEGVDGRYWCRQCLRSGDAIQFCRDFMGMDFVSACAKAGRRPLHSAQLAARPKGKFVPKLLEMPSEIWQKRALVCVQECHQHLLAHPHLLNQDKDRGLTRKNIVDFQLGWNPADIFELRELWGLSDLSEKGGARFLCLPQGIVIPSFRSSMPIRVKIRRSNWKSNNEYPKYHIIAGGMTCPSLYGVIGKAAVLVEAELDAMLINRFAGDICCCIALGGVSIRPDIVVDQALHKAPRILFALDFDDAGKKAYKFWQSTYSHIKPWPISKGKSPGDAYSLGVDLRSWVEAGLRREAL
jgi:DNA primase